MLLGVICLKGVQTLDIKNFIVCRKGLITVICLSLKKVRLYFIYLVNMFFILIVFSSDHGITLKVLQLIVIT